MKKYAWLLFTFLLSINANLTTWAADQWNERPENYNVKLQIVDAKSNKKVAEFKVAIADDEAKKEYGLMNLSQLSKKNGMLFLFDQPQIIHMWMKNTKVPLDMVFIDESDTIVDIKSDASPESLDIISPKSEAKKVLEINGGLVSKFGISIGQKIAIKSGKKFHRSIPRTPHHKHMAIGHHHLSTARHHPRP